jgi:hypothetical protein
MSTDSTTGADDESIVDAADRHRRLQAALAACDQVEHVDTTCNGVNAPPETPAFTTELVLAPEYDAVGPVVLETIADVGLGIEIVQPQGPPGQRSLVATVRR